MRREGGDLPAHMAVLTAQQQEVHQQLNQLQGNFDEVVRELAETRRKQAAQQQLMKSMLDYIQKQSGGHRKLIEKRKKGRRAYVCQ